MGAIGLTKAEEKAVVEFYEKKGINGKRKYTQDELANHFHVAPVTIRRALAEQGVVKLKGYKTRQETAMLALLEKHSIKTVKDLESFLNATEVA